jgi:hypothetical protein
VLCGALAAGGCGTGKVKQATPTKEPSGPREVTKLTADPKLAEALGARTVRAFEDHGCLMGTQPLEEAVHVDSADDLDHRSFPPTSGRHFPDWAPWGLYDEPVPDGYAVHNLEHGGVVVWLGEGVTDAQRDAIADLLDDGEKWLVAPRDDLEGLFTAAWGAGAYCPTSALERLDPKQLATALDGWYDAMNSTGSPAEKDLPAYAGAMKEPVPAKDISKDTPTF